MIWQVFEAVADNGAVVPALWRLAVANSLTMAMWQQPITLDFRQAALADLAPLDIVADPHTDTRARRDILAAADRSGVALHGDAYPELAQRRGLALATLDTGLRVAGRGLRVAGVALGVTLPGLSAA